MSKVTNVEILKESKNIKQIELALGSIQYAIRNYFRDYPDREGVASACVVHGDIKLPLEISKRMNQAFVLDYEEIKYQPRPDTGEPAFKYGLCILKKDYDTYVEKYGEFDLREDSLKNENKTS